MAFLDEIFKASSSILNALLRILNERIFHNGNQPQRVPLRSLIAASNELPTGQEELGALYDRFLMRIFVGLVHDDQMHRLFDTPSEAHQATTQLTPRDLQAVDGATQQVTVPLAVREAIRGIWAGHKEAFKEDRRETRSDRRFVKLLKLLRVAAATNHRTEVDLSDAMLLQHCLWNHPDNMEKVRNIVVSTLKSHSCMVPVAGEDGVYEVGADGKQLVQRLTAAVQNVAVQTNRSPATTSRAVQGHAALQPTRTKTKGFAGRGTAQDPIRIETAEDLVSRHRSVSAVIARLPATMSPIRCSDTPMSLAIRYLVRPSGLRNSSSSISPTVTGAMVRSIAPSSGSALIDFLLDATSNKRLISPQIPPLPHRQIPQHHTPNADALQAHHMQANLFAHAADLALFSLDQHEAQLLGIHPLHLSRLERLVLQAKAMAQAGELFGREHSLHVLRHHALALGTVGRPLHAHQIFLLDAAVFTDEGAGHAAILREYQQADGVDVEPTAGGQTSGVLWRKAAAVRRRSHIAAPLAGRTDERGCGFVAIFGLAAHIAHWLVQQDRHLAGLLVARLGQHLDLDVRQHRHAHLGGLAVDQHPAARDPGVGLAARAQAELGHALVQAHLAFGVANPRQIGPTRINRAGHRTRRGRRSGARRCGAAIAACRRTLTVERRTLPVKGRAISVKS